MLNLSLTVHQVRLDWLPLPCIALIRPSQLSCLGNSVGRTSTSQAICRGFEPPEPLYFIFHGKRDVQVVLPCFELGLTVPICMYEVSNNWKLSTGITYPSHCSFYLSHNNYYVNTNSHTRLEVSFTEHSSQEINY